MERVASIGFWLPLFVPHGRLAMRILYAILLIIALTIFSAPKINAEIIQLRANATVRDVRDDQGVTSNSVKVGDPVVILLTYNNSVTNRLTSPDTAHYDFNSRSGSFSISVGDLTWEHDFGVGELKARVFNDYETPSPPHDRFDISGRGVLEDTFPFAQAGLNYFNFKLIDKDGGMFDSLDLPDDLAEIDVASLKLANGVVQARDTESSIIWSFQYYVDDVDITRPIKSETSLLLSIATLIFIALIFCAVFILVVACIAHLMPEQCEQEHAADNVARDE